MSLRWRLGLAAGLAVALAVVAVAVSAYAGTSSELKSQLDNSLQGITGSILAHGPPPGFQSGGGHGSGLSSTGVFNPGGGDGHTTDPDEGLGLGDRGRPAFGGAAGTLVLVRRDGSTFAPPGQSQTIPVGSRARGLAASGSGHYFTDMEVNGTDIRVLATGIGWRGALLVALPLTDVNRALDHQLPLLILIAAGGILLAAFLGALVARTALSPIARFTRQTEAIATRPELLDQQRLDAAGKDELARLAQTFNRTLDALETSVQAQRNLVADASHELRTPIATIRANLQLMRDEKLLSPDDREALRADVIDELDELTALVADVVELARGTKPPAEPGDVRLDEIVSAAIERTRRRAPQITVKAALEPILVRGEGDRIDRAVNNLLDNATKWSPPEGTVEVMLHEGELTVRDHGPGFKEEDLPFVFDRFHRARDARSKPGSGLGLAIVRQAAEAHGGYVTAQNAPDGGALMRIGFGPAVKVTEVPQEAATGSPASAS
jgi:two-component system sensor histidine kinase MprB